MPEGGFYLLLDFSPFSALLEKRGISSGSQLCEILLAEAGVALLPGAAFGLPPTSFTARLAYVDFAGEAALRDAHQIDETGATYATKMLDGIRVLREWFLQPDSSR